jgi:hypothetical protein
MKKKKQHKDQTVYLQEKIKQIFDALYQRDIRSITRAKSNEDLEKSLIEIWNAALEMAVDECHATKKVLKLKQNWPVEEGGSNAR